MRFSSDGSSYSPKNEENSNEVGSEVLTLIYLLKIKYLSIKH